MQKHYFYVMTDMTVTSWGQEDFKAFFVSFNIITLKIVENIII